MECKRMFIIRLFFLIYFNEFTSFWVFSHNSREGYNFGVLTEGYGFQIPRQFQMGDQLIQ